MEAEIHVAGIIVYASAGRRASVEAAINAIPGARVHAASECGKLVVTLEAAGSREMAGLSDHIRQIHGVIDAVLVYQHAESLESMNQEISNEHLA